MLPTYGQHILLIQNSHFHSVQLSQACYKRGSYDAIVWNGFWLHRGSEIVSMGCFTYLRTSISAPEARNFETSWNVMEIRRICQQKRNLYVAFQVVKQNKRTANLPECLRSLLVPYEQRGGTLSLLDEPTSSLDVFHQYHVLSLRAKSFTKTWILRLLSRVTFGLSLAAQACRSIGIL